jgi:hypothetical protein
MIGLPILIFGGLLIGLSHDGAELLPLFILVDCICFIPTATIIGVKFLLQ